MTLLAEWLSGTAHVGRRVLVYDEVDSTSTRCAALAHDPANDGVAVLAHAQTAGRGQHGRSWLCERGAGVLLSVLLFPPAHLRRPAILTAWAAVAVADVVQELTEARPRIKWPNDVLVHGRKICGILIEQKHGVIAGIGLNVNQSRESFAASGLTDAGSLRMISGAMYNVESVARSLLAALDRSYQILTAGDLLPLEARWRERLGLSGRLVRVEAHAATHVGHLREVSLSGLVLDAGGDAPLLFAPEAVLHITPQNGTSSEDG